MAKTIKVLIADDSSVMRKLLRDLLETDSDIRVVATARNGIEAVKIVSQQKIDVITMDIEMPKMDGLTALQRIMSENPTPTIMLSAMDRRHADIVMKSFKYGAVDFISKTSGTLSLDIDKKAKEIIKKIKVASNIKVRKLTRKMTEQPLIYVPGPITKDKIVAIGASTGGPKALMELLSRLPRNIPAGILIVQHMPEGFTESFSERLNWETSIEVREAKHGDGIVSGVALVAPGNKHMEVVNGRIALNKKKRVHAVRPSADVLMNTVARVYGKNAVGVLMTGMGSDGAKGMREIKKNGGRTIVQSEETCIVFGMPKEAIALGAVDHVVPLDDLAMKIIECLEESDT